MRRSVKTGSAHSVSDAGMKQLILAYRSDPNAAITTGFRFKNGFIYTQVRAITARINQNFDGWPSTELKKSFRTFLGKPCFVNHQNFDPTAARGKVVAARYREAGDDKYIEVVQEIDAQRFPKLAKEIKEGGMDSVSMGVEAGFTICSYCGNKAVDVPEFCDHVKYHKGEKLSRMNRKTGKREDVLVYEKCYKLGFFELSFVFDPADETALVSRVIAAGRYAQDAAPAQVFFDELQPGVMPTGAPATGQMPTAARRLAVESCPITDPNCDSGGGGIQLDTSSPSQAATPGNLPGQNIHPSQNISITAPDTPSTPSGPSSPSSPGTPSGPSTPKTPGGVPQAGDAKYMPQTKPLYDELMKDYPGADIGTYRVDSYHEHDHGAMDFMTKDPSQADAVRQKAFAAGAPYVLWQQKQWNPDGSTTPMENRGSPTENHMDHVHIAPIPAPPAAKAARVGSAAANDAAEARLIKQQMHRQAFGLGDLSGLVQGLIPGATSGGSGGGSPLGVGGQMPQMPHMPTIGVHPADGSEASTGIPASFWGPSSGGSSSSTSPSSPSSSTSPASPAGPAGPTPAGSVPIVQKPDGTWTSPDPNWAHLLNRESGGNASIVNTSPSDPNAGPNASQGLFQFTPQTWHGLGYSGMPGQATPQQQAEAAGKLIRRNPSGGDWGAGLSGREDAGGLLRGLSASRADQEEVHMIKQQMPRQANSLPPLPEDLQERALFHQWLDEHPQYQQWLGEHPQYHEWTDEHQMTAARIDRLAWDYRKIDTEPPEPDKGRSFGDKVHDFFDPMQHYPLRPEDMPKDWQREHAHDDDHEIVHISRLVYGDDQPPANATPGAASTSGFATAPGGVVPAYNDLPHDDKFFSGITGRRHWAFGETEAPEDVDTLRKDNEGDEFQHYVESPPELQAPNMDQTKRLDRAQEQQGLDVDRRAEDVEDVPGSPMPSRAARRRERKVAMLVDPRTGRRYYAADEDPEAGPPPSDDEGGGGGQSDEELIAEAEQDLESAESQESGDEDDEGPDDDEDEGPPDEEPDDDESDAPPDEDEDPDESGDEDGGDLPPWMKGGGRNGNRRSSTNKRRRTRRGAPMSLAQRAQVVAARQPRRHYAADGSYKTDGGPYGEEGQGEQEDLFISQTPGTEGVAVPTPGDGTISNSPNNLVANLSQRIQQRNVQQRRDLIAYEQITGRRLTADDNLPNPPDESVRGTEVPSEVNPTVRDTAAEALTGNDFGSVALPHEETHAKDARAFRALDDWFLQTTGRTAHQHNDPVFIRQAAARFCQGTGVAVESLFPALGHVLREARRSADMRRYADEKMDVAAPQDRIDVEKPVSNTTDAEAQASQFKPSDFGGNASDNLADPEQSPDSQIWAPGEGEAARKSSNRKAEGMTAVRYAEAYIRVGLAPNTPESKWEIAGLAQTMRHGTIVDRIRLLDAVSAAHQASSRRTAGVSRGTGRNLPTGVGQRQLTAGTVREAANDPNTDSALFFKG